MSRLATLDFDKSLLETSQIILNKRNKVQYLIKKEEDINEKHFKTIFKAFNFITKDLYAVKRFRKTS